MNDDPDRIDRILTVLADKDRRRVVEYFSRNGTETETVEVLGARLARLTVKTDGTAAPSTKTVRTELHHVHLPKLEEYGVVEYDARTGQVRYRPDEEVEAAVDSLADL